MPDFYRILGVSAGASDKEVKQAYYELAKKWHPDVQNSTEAKERFRLISEAYENLKTAEARAAYRFEADLVRSEEDQHWTRRKSGGGGADTSPRQNSYSDVQMEFDEAEKKWRQKNFKGHERTITFMKTFERIIHPKTLFFIIPAGLLLYWGLSTGVKFAYGAIKDFSQPVGHEGSTTASTTLKKKRKAAGKKALDEVIAAEKDQDVTNKVQAWKNPATGKYETPAPWDPQFSPKLVKMVDRSKVSASTFRSKA